MGEKETKLEKKLKQASKNADWWKKQYDRTGNTMATTLYALVHKAKQADAGAVYPIVLYARTINKNTAEFTASDLRKFLRWLWKTYPTLNLKRSWNRGRTWARPSTTSTSSCPSVGRRVKSQSSSRRPAMQK